MKVITVPTVREARQLTLAGLLFVRWRSHAEDITPGDLLERRAFCHSVRAVRSDWQALVTKWGLGSKSRPARASGVRFFMTGRGGQP